MDFDPETERAVLAISILAVTLIVSPLAALFKAVCSEAALFAVNSAASALGAVWVITAAITPATIHKVKTITTVLLKAALRFPGFVLIICSSLIFFVPP